MAYQGGADEFVSGAPLDDHNVVDANDGARTDQENARTTVRAMVLALELQTNQREC